MKRGDDNDSRNIYWHSELPPLGAVMIAEYTVEATSTHVPGTLAYRDELWTQCYDDLMAQLRLRLAQEIVRLGGDCAHVLSEWVDSKHDAVKGDACTWSLDVRALPPSPTRCSRSPFLNAVCHPARSIPDPNDDASGAASRRQVPDRG